MPDISELLATEAVRLQPAHQPAFTDLVRARAKHSQRHRLAVGAAAILIVGAGGGSAVLGSGHEPVIPPRPGMVRAPLGAVSPSATATVVITGVLQWIGGRVGTPSHGIAGMVHFQASDGTVVDVMAGKDGHFSIGVPAGTYIVAGTLAQSSVMSCRAEAPVVVPDGGLSDVQVNCHIR